MKLDWITERSQIASGRLQREIVWYLGVLAIVSVLIVGSIGLKISEDLLRAQAVQNAQAVARAVLELVERTWDPTRSDGGIESTIKRMAVRGGYPSGVKQWNLFSASGRWRGGTEPQVNLTERNFLSTLPIAPRVVVERNEAITVFLSVQPKKEPVGILSLSFPDHSAREGFRKVAVAIIMFVIAFAGVLLLFGYRLIRHVVVNPLQQIERAAEAIAAGDTGRPVPVVRDNEIGRLGAALDLMRRHLLTDQEKLADYAQSLENLNQKLEEAQNALLRGEKLASVGRLAAGVAHEVGNPLGAVLGYLSLLKSVTQDSETTELLARCESELTRISRIVRQLLEYARPQAANPDPCDINDVIRSAVEGVQGHGISPGLTIRLELSADVPLIPLDPDPLRQVLWNLVLNAVQVLGDQGIIVVRTQRLSIQRLREQPLGTLFRARTRRGDSARPGILELRQRRRREDTGGVDVEEMRSERAGLPAFLFSESGEVIQTVVEDNGPGIPLDELTKIFDPFYTTKPPGKGTGLGLFISLNLVQNMGGYLDVQSEIGKGTRFIFLLPISVGTARGDGGPSTT